MDKVAHTEMYLEALELLSKEAEQEKEAVSKGLVQGVLKSTAEGMRGKGQSGKEIYDAIKARAPKTVARFKADGGAVGLQARRVGDDKASDYIRFSDKETFMGVPRKVAKKAKPARVKESFDRAYMEAMEKVARKYTAKETEIGAEGNIGAGLLGPLQAFGAPEGRRLRTAGHIYGKGLIGNLGGRAVAKALSTVMRHHPLEAAVLEGALAMAGTAAGSIHGYHTGKKGRGFFDSMGK